MAIQDAAEYLTANVGLEVALATVGTETVTANVGLQVGLTTEATESLTGELLDGGAAPVIYGLVPSAARGGDGISVIGSGFGATQLERAGVVETFNGLTWEGMSVNSWARIAPSADADTVDHAIDPASGVFDPEHEQIDVSVPAWATPPSLQIRVRTTA